MFNILTIKEMQIRVLWDFILHQSEWTRSKNQTITNSSVSVENGKHSILFWWGEADCYSHCENQYGDSLKYLEIDLPNGSAIPLLGINPKDSGSYHRDSCSPVFSAALFTIARTWKEPRCSLIDHWKMKVWLIYTIKILFSS